MLSHLARITCMLTILAAARHVPADETSRLYDPVAKIAACLPRTWKVSLASRHKEMIIRIETDAVDTVPSLMSSEVTRIERAVVTIEFQVLPKHPPKMLRRIREYNEPIVAQLKKVPYRSAQGQQLTASMIAYPLFQDEQYGYLVVPPTRVPSRGEDIQIIEDVLRKVCAGWKPVDGSKRVVDTILDYFSPG